MTCPIDYELTVNGASLQIFDNSFELNIQGTGILRVLYADRNLRIFTSPQSDDPDEVGTTVVQVRIDLLKQDFAGVEP